MDVVLLCPYASSSGVVVVVLSRQLRFWGYSEESTGRKNRNLRGYYALFFGVLLDDHIMPYSQGESLL